MGSKATEACGLSDVYCGLGLLGVDVVMVDGQSHPHKGYLLWGNFLNGQIRRAVGPADSHVDVQAPLPLLNGPSWLGQWLVYLLGLS